MLHNSEYFSKIIKYRNPLIALTFAVILIKCDDIVLYMWSFYIQII